MSATGELTEIDPELIEPNPRNPRRYFNEERLDLLRTSIQEVGILVPLIAYRRTVGDGDRYVLMDGERRWRWLSISLCRRSGERDPGSD